MEGKQVRVYLRTPLYRGTSAANTPMAEAQSGMGVPRRRRADAAEELAIDATSIIGTVVAESRTGVHLRIEALLDDAGTPAPLLPFAEIVVPVSKIDYVVLLGD